MAAVNVFLSVNYKMLMSLERYFSTTVLIGWVLDGSLLHSVLSDFLEHILEGTVVTF